MKNSEQLAIQENHTPPHPPLSPVGGEDKGEGDDSARQNVRYFVQRTLFPVARRFIAGQTLKEALAVVADLNRRGFSTTLDHLGESVTRTSEAQSATEHYVVILKALKEQRLDLNVSVKPTQLGLAISRDLFAENLRRLVKVAEDVGGCIRVDMEGSATTSTTLAVVSALKEQKAPVGAVVQAMLRRTPHDVVTLLESGVTMRLCKGAYKEPSDVAYQKKPDVNRQYIALMKRLLTSNLYHGIATHDETLIAATKAFVKEQNISRDAFEFQMLYGIRTGLQEELRREGFRVRIYVPFGRAWLPYTIRRLRERKENVWFVVRNLFRP